MGNNFWNTIGANAISGGMGMLMSKWNDQRQLKQQQALNDMQLASNKSMSDYQYNKQLEMWNATNYPAQMEQLKKAGLNAGLLYGQSGGGGTTTGGGAASVNAANAPSGGGEVMGMMSNNIALQQAQIRLINAQADKLNSETPTSGNIGDTNIANTSADTNNKILQNNLLKIEGEIKDATKENAISLIQATQQNAWRNNDLLTTGVWVNNNTAKAQVEEANAKAIGALLTNKEIASRTNINDEQRKAISVKLAQEWTALQIAEKNASTNAKNANINADNAETNRLNQIVNGKRLEWESSLQKAGITLGADIVKILVGKIVPQM
jgi:hypothetical protein